jgi:hypothetical protein
MFWLNGRLFRPRRLEWIESAPGHWYPDYLEPIARPPRCIGKPRRMAYKIRQRTRAF